MNRVARFAFDSQARRAFTFKMQVAQYALGAFAV